MRPDEKFLQGLMDMPGVEVDPAVLETLAKRASAVAVGSGTPLEAEVIQAIQASGEQLTPEHVRRVTETANTQTHLSNLDAGGGYPEFNVADPGRVWEGLQSEPPPPVESADLDYSGPPPEQYDFGDKYSDMGRYNRETGEAPGLIDPDESPKVASRVYRSGIGKFAAVSIPAANPQQASWAGNFKDTPSPFDSLAPDQSTRLGKMSQQEISAVYDHPSVQKVYKQHGTYGHPDVDTAFIGQAFPKPAVKIAGIEGAAVEDVIPDDDLRSALGIRDLNLEGLDSATELKLRRKLGIEKLAPKQKLSHIREDYLRAVDDLQAQAYNAHLQSKLAMAEFSRELRHFTVAGGDAGMAKSALLKVCEPRWANAVWEEAADRLNYIEEVKEASGDKTCYISDPSHPLVDKFLKTAELMKESERLKIAVNKLSEGADLVHQACHKVAGVGG